MGTAELLPVADAAGTRRWIGATLRGHRRALIAVALWFGLATGCGLVIPALVGQLVAKIGSNGATMATVNEVSALILVFLLAQSVLSRTAFLAAAQFGESMLARLREGFVESVLALPQTRVERAGTGDLLSRSFRDISMLSETARSALPAVLTAGLSVALTVVAMLIVSPLMALASLVAIPVIGLATRWYLNRARAAYLEQGAAYGQMTAVVSETIAGARTVESLRAADRRDRLTDASISDVYAAERRTLFVRSVWYPIVDMGYILPVVTVLLFGGWAYSRGWVGLSGVVTSVLYTRALIDPLDVILSWLDQLQTAGASLSRVIGVNQAVEPPAAGAARPDTPSITAAEVSFAYRDDHDVVTGLSLHVAEGERVAVVGPSGAGKSTLGLLLAGVLVPREGLITIGGVPLQHLSPADRRREVALVSQEHHLFAATIRENVSLADPDADDQRIMTAIDAVDAKEWVIGLPDGLDTVVGSGGYPVPLARAQQLSLARLVLANPRTLILDEATSLMDSRSARHVERSLAGLVKGRTVIAVVHRLHTAEDADRVVMMEHGNITDIGSHDELLAHDGPYRRLWISWHGTP